MSKPPAVPSAMHRNGRPIDQEFHPDEYLFRRVPTRIWDQNDGPLPGIEAIELPDISIGRSKYGHPEWVRFNPANDSYFKTWGVIGVRVGRIPASLACGTSQYSYSCSHEPLDTDFPHTEIRAFLDGLHLQMQKDIPEDMHLEWRELLRREIEAILRPRQACIIRHNCPLSQQFPASKSLVFEANSINPRRL